MQYQNAKDVVIAQQGHRKGAPEVAERLPVARLPSGFSEHVWNVHDLTIEHCAADDAVAARGENAPCHPLLKLIGECVGRCQDVAVSLAAPDEPLVRATKSRCGLSESVKDLL